MFQARKSEISSSTVFICETETGGVRSSWIPRDSWRCSCHENTLHVEVTVLDGVVHISPKNMKRSYSSHLCFWNWVNPTRGSRLGCIHEGQSDTCNEGEQKDRNTQANVSPCQASRELEKQTSYEMMTGG